MRPPTLRSDSRLGGLGRRQTHWTQLLCVVVLGLSAGCSKLYDADLLDFVGIGGEGGSGDMDAGPSGSGGEGGDSGDGGSGGSAGSGGEHTCLGGDCFWSDSPEVNSCRSVRAPDESWRPEDTASNTIPPIYLGLERLWIGGTFLEGDEPDEDSQHRQPADSYGLDLDGVCTYTDDCWGDVDDQVPAQSCKPRAVGLPYDGELCRDNMFARLQPIAAAVPEIGGVFGLAEENFNCELWRGSYNTLFKISGYNGQQNDEQVRVDFYHSGGTEQQQAWRCPLDDFDELYPRWLTGRRWLVAEESLSEPIETEGEFPDAVFHDAEAFVRNGYLIARIPEDYQIRLTGPSAGFPGWSMDVTGGYFIGKLVSLPDTTWRIEDGLIATRIPVENLFLSFRRLALCPEGDTAIFYSGVEEYVEGSADLLASGENDPEATCDAVSIGIAYHAAQITPGGTIQLPPLVDCCLPENEDATNCTVGCGDGRVFGDELCDTAIPAGQQGACPTSCPSDDACRPRVLQGEGCYVRCVETLITAPQDDDGCCPSNANANNDNDCSPVCGNSVVEPGESCDPVAACPTADSCQPSDVCELAALSGAPSQCNSACQRSPINFCSGSTSDGCCPDDCVNDPDDTELHDADCVEAGLCGNGQLDDGEHCDDSSANEEHHCPVACDDGNVCTTNLLLGNPAACTARCSFPAITDPIDGDGCCPPGANAGNDSDCTQECGNGVVEPGEECDWAAPDAPDNCNMDCTLTSDYDVCLENVSDETTEACRQCTCEQCTHQALECFVNYSDDENTRCGDVVKCGRDSGCTGETCYCGNQSTLCCEGINLFCSNGTGGNGPCKPEIEAAGESTSASTLQSRKTNLNYPLGRANAFGECIEANCSAECL